MSDTVRPMMPRIASAAWITGVLAAGLATVGSLLVQGEAQVTVLRIGVWTAISFGVLGLVTGLLSRNYLAGRRAALASIALLVIVAAFMFWSTPARIIAAPPSG